MMTPLEFTTNSSCYAPSAPAVVPDSSVTTTGMISAVAPVPSTQDQASAQGPQCGAAPTWFYMLMAFAVMSGIGARQ